MRMVRVEGHSFIKDFLGERAVVVDLGANEGRFCAYFLSLPGCRVLSVEPVPELFDDLPDAPGLTKSRYAVTGEGGSIELSLNSSRCASAYLPEATADAIVVPAVTLTGLLSEFDIRRIDLLKMDIEGAEVSVIQATPDDVLLCADQITVEFHDFVDPRMRVAVDKAIERLRALGFQLLQISHTDRSDLLFVNPRLRLSKVTRAALIARYHWVHGGLRRAAAVRRRLAEQFSPRSSPG